MKRLIALFALLAGIAHSLLASDSTKIRSIFEDFYQPGQIVEVTLQFDCKKLLRQKQQQQKFPATITYQDAEGKLVNRSIHVKTRGKLRLDVCSFPPLKLDFDEKELESQHFSSEIDDLKLVTHCYDGKKNNQTVAREFLAYRLYNILSEYSFRVQLLHIRYLNENGELYADNLAFMIEPTDAMAARLNCHESEANVKNTNLLHPQVYADMLLFEYMIGNVDWDITMRHNTKLLRPTQGGAYIPVPYDFDISGLVRAPYAAPQTRMNQRYVGQRLLLGEFASEAFFQASVQHFLETEQAILSACANDPLLEEKEREKTVQYLRPFFDRIKRQNLSLNNF